MCFISKGSYGSVFKPAFESLTLTDFGIITVGKIFKHAIDEKDEHKNNMIMKKLDKHNQFTVPYFGIHKIILDDDTIETLKAAGLRKRRQLVYSYGGISLEKYMRIRSDQTSPIPIPFLTILKNLKPVVAGILLMQKRGYCHADIKPANMVMDDYGVIKLIDFGIMTSFENLSSNDIIMSAPYAYYPVELLLIDYYRAMKIKYECLQEELDAEFQRIIAAEIQFIMEVIDHKSANSTSNTNSSYKPPFPYQSDNQIHSRYAEYKEISKTFREMYTSGNKGCTVQYLHELTTDKSLNNSLYKTLLIHMSGSDQSLGKLIDPYSFAISILMVYYHVRYNPLFIPESDKEEVNDFVNKMLLPMVHLNPMKRLSLSKAYHRFYKI